MTWRHELLANELKGIGDLAEARRLSKGSAGVHFFKCFKQVKEGRETFALICKQYNVDHDKAWKDVDGQTVYDQSLNVVTLFSAARIVFEKETKPDTHLKNLADLCERLAASPLKLPPFALKESRVALGELCKQLGTAAPGAASPTAAAALKDGVALEEGSQQLGTAVPGAASPAATAALTDGAAHTGDGAARPSPAATYLDQDVLDMDLDGEELPAAKEDEQLP